MSTIERDLAQELEAGERLKSLGNVDDEAILADLDAVIERRRMTRLREVILEVIDDGDPASKAPWAIDHVFEDCANDARLRFCDEVERRFQRG